MNSWCEKLQRSLEDNWQPGATAKMVETIELFLPKHKLSDIESRALDQVLDMVCNEVIYEAIQVLENKREWNSETNYRT